MDRILTGVTAAAAVRHYPARVAPKRATMSKPPGSSFGLTLGEFDRRKQREYKGYFPSVGRTEACASVGQRGTCSSRPSTSKEDAQAGKPSPARNTPPSPLTHFKWVPGKSAELTGVRTGSPDGEHDSPSLHPSALPTFQAPNLTQTQPVPGCQTHPHHQIRMCAISLGEVKILDKPGSDCMVRMAARYIPI